MGEWLPEASPPLYQEVYRLVVRTDPLDTASSSQDSDGGKHFTRLLGDRPSVRGAPLSSHPPPTVWYLGTGRALYVHVLRRSSLAPPPVFPPPPSPLLRASEGWSTRTDL